MEHLTASIRNDIDTQAGRITSPFHFTRYINRPQGISETHLGVHPWSNKHLEAVERLFKHPRPQTHSLRDEDYLEGTLNMI